MAEQPHAMDSSLPLTVEGITADWLTRALGFRHPGTEVTAVMIEDVNSMTSTKIRVRLTYGTQGRAYGLPSTMIVKGGFGPHSPRLKPMYNTEVRFYRDVRALAEINAPKCYYAGSDPDSYQSIVILEDLRPKNVTFCNVRRPLSYEQTARFLDAFARFHAQTWNSPEFREGGCLSWLKSRDEAFGREYFLSYLKPELWKQCIQSTRGAAISTRLHDFDWIRPAMQKIFEHHRLFPSCVIHGDSHVGNTYIEADGTPGFLDSQPTRGPWQMDITKFLVGALDVVDRRAWEQPLLAYYLERLSSYGIQAPRYEDAWLAHRREIAYGFIVFVINENAFQTEDINLAYAARFAEAMIDHGTKDLLFQ